MSRQAAARIVALTLLCLMVGSGGCASSKTPADVQENFGVRMAKMNLWREAMFRFQRAVEMNPEDATAYNNLAVALEANGDFDGAAKAYREAMRLDRSNQYIQKNYSRFVEFTTRERRRQQQQQQQQQRAPAAQTATAENEEKEEEAAEEPAEGEPPPAEPQPAPVPPNPPGGSS